MSRPAIGFAGLTHLGIVSAVAAAARGFPVVAFDLDPARVAALAAGELPIVEPCLPQLLRQHRERVSFTATPTDLRGCAVVYVATDVPIDETGASDLRPVRDLIERVAGSLAPETALVILSQVPPGFTRGLGRPPAQTFYQVETLVFGRAVERALEPERFIVGCGDPAAALPGPLAEYLEAFGCPILRMRYESAELAKISINMCLVASITAANTLAELCEHIGADWSEIVPALRLDRRIGTHAYLTPGLGIGGGNLERDLATVCRLADDNGTDAGVVRAWNANSAHRRDWALTQIHERVVARVAEPALAVLGLAYKEDTASTRNSPALSLLTALAPFVVRAYDPVVTPESEFHPRLVTARSALEACVGADAMVIMTPWPEFRELRPDAVAARLRGRTVVDPYGLLEGPAFRAAGFDYVTLGYPIPRAAA